jgi:hypothetical protein
MNNTIAYQRLEGLAIFFIATFVFFQSDFSWLAYILLLFAFDISMIGYVVNTRVGAYVYNFGHSFIVPALLVAAYTLTDSRLALGLACLWFAHIGIDRALGYGLKFTSGFQHTHLGKIGK